MNAFSDHLCRDFVDEFLNIQFLRLPSSTGFLGLLNFGLDGGEFLLISTKFN
jgi:hypothetical protein